MATGPATLPDSLDGRGLSTITTTMAADASVPTQGTAYHPQHFAAGVPVYFHGLTGGKHLALLRERWTDATVGDLGPQSYTEHTAVHFPGAVVIDPVTGRQGATMDLPGRMTRLSGACGQRSLFWTSGTTVDAEAIVSLYRVTGSGGIELVADEVLPAIDDVLFDAGCALDAGNLVVFGRDTEDKVYGMRKLASRVGVQTEQAPWRYSGGARGWQPDVADLDSIGLESAGPVSMAQRSDGTWMTTVAVDTDGVRTGQVYRTQRLVSTAWSPVGEVVALGDDDSYLGGGLYLQPQINANLAVTETPALTYVTSVLNAEASEESIQTAWGYQSVV
ncbi:hypothetical protein SEA_SKOG_222 [Gordonia phage Skog]|uniref:Uncharacterized protein n=1 Tax=Gordonia phage Skog TaxID=2704033 RepID=A0A6G6XK32_9CAUD|nr:hypothetical protein KHQ85_gp222 [Gordonia phage Skog]QIG58374.1 hypothetical protein SEA_SKOG_222 [Gordonia phage Skog]